MIQKCLKYTLMGLFAALVVTFLLPRHKEESRPRDYDEIAASGVLNATTEYNSVSFHVEEDTLAGFHYELIRAFAEEKGLHLQLTPEMDIEKQVIGINSGTYDVIAHSMLVTVESKDSLLAFTVPLLRRRQVLVQRNEALSGAAFVHDQLELAGKTVYIPHASPIRHRIRNLSQEIGDTIIARELKGYGTEQLMALVAHGDIDYAVCEASVVRASLPDFPQLDARTAISLNQFYAWGVSKRSPVLLDSLNQWLQRFMQSQAYAALLKKYGQD